MPSEAPRLGSAVVADEAATPASEGDQGESGSGEGATRPVLKLRNFQRRRRRLPHPPGMRPGSGEQAEAAEGEAAPAEALQDGAPAGEGEAGARPERPPGAPRRRRRRRRGPRPEGAAASPDAAAGEGAATAPGTERPPGRSRFGRNRRPRREGEQGTAGAPREGDGRERSRGPRTGAAGGERRDRRDRGDGPRGRRSGPGGRGRDGPPRRVERKLYSMDAVVDRGFEDVEVEGETKRVHWTIVKRTVADQISRKPVSASYVLQREGDDSEFPTLGAARDAVNKTIVHPEKLTPSKSEIAALKGSSR